MYLDIELTFQCQQSRFPTRRSTTTAVSVIWVTGISPDVIVALGNHHRSRYIPVRDGRSTNATNLMEDRLRLAEQNSTLLLQ